MTASFLSAFFLRASDAHLMVRSARLSMRTCVWECRSLFAQDRSPRMRRASWMSLGMMVSRLAWIAHRLVSSKRETK